MATPTQTAKKAKTRPSTAAPRSTSPKKAIGKPSAAKKATPKKVAPEKKANGGKPSVTRKKAGGKTSKPRVATPSPRPNPASLELIHGIVPYREKRNERYMNERHIGHFDNILKSWRHELVDDLERTVSAMQDELLNLPDPNDRASQETDRSLELRTRDRERKLIRKIDESRASIASGDYGYCENCGIEIGVQRLEARPTATQCIDCKNLNELREKQGY
jgi:DnaK suppressor protein